MPRDYNSTALSKIEMLSFIIFSVSAGCITGLLFYDSILPGAAISSVLFCFLPAYKESIKEKRKKELRLQFRDLLYSVSSSVSSGRSMSEALEESIEFWRSTYEEQDYIIQELYYMVGRIKNGNEKDIDVLKNFALRSNIEDVSDFVNVYENCRLSGGNLSRAIDRATTIIGDKITLERELETMMSQKKFESRIVILAPFILIMMLRLTSPDYLEPLFTTAGGRAVTTISLILIGTAVYMMERINRVEI